MTIFSRSLLHSGHSQGHLYRGETWIRKTIEESKVTSDFLKSNCRKHNWKEKSWQYTKQESRCWSSALRNCSSHQEETPVPTSWPRRSLDWYRGPPSRLLSREEEEKKTPAEIAAHLIMPGVLFSRGFMLISESLRPIEIVTLNVFGIAAWGISFCHCLNSSTLFINSLFQQIFIDCVQVLCKC